MKPSAFSLQHSAFSNRHSRRARRGVSLLEVLISIFVILGGMLGVAALLPVGRYEMSMCLRADRAGNAGRAALRDAQVRGMLDPNAWCWYGGQMTPPLDMPVAIDPLGWAANLGTVFPVKPPNQVVLSMPRVTLKSFVDTSLPQPLLFERARVLADRIFTLQDDLVFDYPSEKTLRPRLLLRYVDGSTGTNLSPSAATAVRENKYSWMMTVVPAESEYDASADGRKLYTLSAVVFYARQLTADGEGTCDVDRASLGPLIGGGDVVLVGADAVEVKTGEWILLRGVKGLGRRPMYQFKWYRVIAADEFNPTAFNGRGGRRLTLAGPDWTDIASCQVLQAGVLPGAIGVYTETVELER